MTGVRTILSLPSAVGIAFLLAAAPVVAQEPMAAAVPFDVPLLLPPPTDPPPADAPAAVYVPGRCLYGYMNRVGLPDRGCEPRWTALTVPACYGVAASDPPPAATAGLPKLWPDGAPTAAPLPPVADVVPAVAAGSTAEAGPRLPDGLRVTPALDGVVPAGGAPPIPDPPQPLPELQPSPPKPQSAPPRATPDLEFKFPEFRPGPFQGGPTPTVTVTPIADVPPPSRVVQAACATCGSSNLPNGPSADLILNGGCATCGGGNGECVPGRFDKGDEAMPSHALGRFLYGIYNCVCVPDPCYEPKWSPLQDSAFFTPTARPVTQTRFRGGVLHGLGTPDRAEYFWARGVGSTRGPMGPNGQRVTRVGNDSFAMYTEGATGKFSAYTELTYHRVRPDEGDGVSGFGDLIVGTKTLLLDCELLQITFQMESTIPTGRTDRGLGTGHLSLEPSLLFGLKLSQCSYLQAQVAEWIPIAGDPDYAGAAIRYSVSYNHVLCRPLASCPIIGTLEAKGITFQDGAYTDPVTGATTRGSGISYVSIGPGLRQFICDRADLGVGSAFGIGDPAGPRQEYRIVLRVRY